MLSILYLHDKNLCNSSSIKEFYRKLVNGFSICAQMTSSKLSFDICSIPISQKKKKKKKGIKSLQSVDQNASNCNLSQQLS